MSLKYVQTFGPDDSVVVGGQSCCIGGTCWCGSMVNVRQLDGSDEQSGVVQRDGLLGIQRRDWVSGSGHTKVGTTK